MFELFFVLTGNLRLTESNAIARHLGRKNGLIGITEVEKAHVDMLENLSYNFHIDFAESAMVPTL